MHTFIESTGRWAIDELCSCGHPLSQHGSKLVPLGDQTLRLAHQGSCCECTCRRFIWAGWLYGKNPSANDTSAAHEGPDTIYYKKKLPHGTEG